MSLFVVPPNGTLIPPYAQATTRPLLLRFKASSAVPPGARDDSCDSTRSPNFPTPSEISKKILSLCVFFVCVCFFFFVGGWGEGHGFGPFSSKNQNVGCRCTACAPSPATSTDRRTQEMRGVALEAVLQVLGGSWILFKWGCK